VALLLITFLKLLTYSCNNKTHIVGYGVGKSLIGLGIGEQELQGISSYRGVEDINISFYKGLKAVK
jgi:hypothetical protein